MALILELHPRGIGFYIMNLTWAFRYISNLVWCYYKVFSSTKGFSVICICTTCLVLPTAFLGS